jgi:hypothetical protein
MKYIITESRLNDIVFKYLDTTLSAIEKRKGHFKDVVFAFPDEEYAVMGWENDSKSLYIHNRISDSIQPLFGLDKIAALDIIAMYVEDRYNLRVDNIKEIDYFLGKQSSSR